MITATGTNIMGGKMRQKNECMWCTPCSSAHQSSSPIKIVTRHVKHTTRHHTVKGHLHQKLKNIRSTSKTTASMTPSILQSTQNKQQTNCVYVSAIEATGRIYTDQTGQFPTMSSHGYKYILILQQQHHSSWTAKISIRTWHDQSLLQTTWIPMRTRTQAKAAEIGQWGDTWSQEIHEIARCTISTGSTAHTPTERSWKSDQHV